MSIGENIANYRKVNGLTQGQLGELLGVTNQAVSKWELGVSMPDIMLLPRIAEALEINIYDLYGTTKNSQVHKGQIQKIDEFSSYDQNDYTNSSWTIFMEQIEVARNILNDEKATQIEIDNILKAN